MIEPILHFLKIHRKVIFGNPPVIVQHMFGKTPKTLNAVNVILGLLVDQLFRVINFVVFAPALQGIVASKPVGVVNRALPGLLADDRHQFLGRDPLDNSSVDSPIALQQAKNNTFTSSASPAPTFPSAAKIGLVQLNLALQLARF